MPSAKGAFLRILGHVQLFAGVLVIRAHIHQRNIITFQRLQHFIPKRADLAVAALLGCVLRGRVLRHFGGQLTALVDPLFAAAIHDLGIGMAKELKNPERIRCPPVVLVTIEHNGGIVADALLAHQRFEPLFVQVIAHQRIVKVAHPVDLNCARNMAQVVQQNIFVAFDQPNVRIVEMLGHPVGLDEHLWPGVGLISLCHALSPFSFARRN